MKNHMKNLKPYELALSRAKARLLKATLAGEKEKIEGLVDVVNAATDELNAARRRLEEKSSAFERRAYELLGRKVAGVLAQDQGAAHKWAEVLAASDIPPRVLRELQKQAWWPHPAQNEGRSS